MYLGYVNEMLCCGYILLDGEIDLNGYCVVIVSFEVV